MNLTGVIEDVVQNIHTNERSKKLVSEKLKPLKNKNLSNISSTLLENQIVYQIGAAELTGKIAGVDSGFVGKSIAGMDVTLVRACAVLFEYSEGMVSKSHYWPSLYAFPQPHFTNGALENDEYNCSKSLLRLREEVKAAKSIIEEHSPQYCFLDGSIIPQYADKPRKDSKVESLYGKILNDFQDLYETAEQNKCDLIACVEDSRGSRFRTIVQEEILSKEKVLNPELLENIFDSSLLDYLLEVGERSFAFKYSKSISEHPILMDYDKKWSTSIYALYLKPAPYDRPLRIEFINRKNNLTEYADRIASVAYSLSSMHREYAYPSVLIEADLRARLKPEEIDIVFNKIVDKLSKHVKIKMRRESRPF